MRYLFFFINLFIGIFCWQACSAQKPCNDTLKVVIENSGLFDEESLISDSLKMEVRIVFEKNFDDSIYVFSDNKLIDKKKIITNKTLGVSLNSITVDYSKNSQVPKVSIVVNGKNCIAFYPQRGKRMAYVNYSDKAWLIELSNVFREYR